MSAEGRAPERTCLGCRTKKGRSLLRRVVLIQDGESLRVVWDVKGALSGRGGWLCPDENCLAAAVRRRAFNRAFKTGENLDLAGLGPVPVLEKK